MERGTEAGGLNLGRPERIAVVRALHLGDLLCSVPLFRALRSCWPGAEITLVGLPWARSIVERFDACLDDLLEFPGWPGIPERTPDPDRMIAFRERARKARFDLAIQAHGSGRWMNDFMGQLQARRTAGFHPVGQPSPGPGFIPYPADRHESLRLLALAAHLGARELSPTLEFPLHQRDRDEAHRLRRELAGERPYACLHPGSSAADRRWSAEGFARVADELAGQGLEVILTGTEDELGLAATVCRLAEHPPRSALGRTTLGGVAALIAEARLLVSNDTGVSHVAAALGVPSVVIFTGSDPVRWAPLATDLHLAVGAGVPDGPDVGDRGYETKRGTPATASDVIHAVRRQLAMPQGVAA
jgi:ADP-heptose:LPS heptosyltransferase